MNNRNQLLDLMRFLAALWVAFFHFNQPIHYIDNPYRNLMKLGYVGVPVFFVISGYCIIFSAERSKNWKDFLVRRLFRIYPPYVMSLAVTFTAIVMFKLITGFNSVATLPKNVYTIFCTIFLLLKPVTRVEGINWVYWTLTLEAIYYIFAGLARVWPERLRLPFFILLSVIGWCLPIGDTGLQAVFKYWPVFSLGIGVYYIQKQQQLVWALLLTGLNIAWLVPVFLLAGEPPYFYASVLAMAFIFLSFKYPMRKNWLSTAGDYSYSVYLLHVPIAIYLMGLIKTPYIQTHMATNILFDICSYLITLYFAYLSFKWIELPSIAFGKSLAQKFTGAKLQTSDAGLIATNHR
jgi:peptidoglycan/LPS O-acetylase OafA/YrhL